MKRISFILAIILIITSGYAQINEKSERKFYKQSDWEFGLSTNIGRSTKKTKVTRLDNYYNYYTGSQSYESKEELIYMHLGLSLGYYIIKGLSIEPEFSINFYSVKFSVSILCNLCYTFYFPQKNIYPYLKLGYGLSNDPDNPKGLFESINFKTVNAGAGLKFMYFPGMAFRIELNYRVLNGSNIPNEYSKNETTTSVISGSLGISILL